MADETNIAWCDKTHNEWLGCTKKSEECLFCYAEELMDTRFGRVQWGPKGTRSLTSRTNRRKPLGWNREAAELGIRYRVFCSSLSDVFEDREELVPWRTNLFNTIRATPNLDWLLLTKRPECIPAMLPADWGAGWDHVWLGTSAGTQRRWDERVPLLRSVPAAVHFVSMEPMIGPIHTAPMLDQFGMDWIIVGGESGRYARPMSLDWVRAVRAECDARAIPFFFKQKGTHLAKQLGCEHPKGENISEWPEDLQVQVWPRSAA